jgi:hypothetical protein
MFGEDTRTPVRPEDREAASRMVVATLASALATGIRTGATEMRVIEPYLQTMAEAGRPVGLHDRLSEMASEWGREQLCDRDIELEMRALAKEMSPNSVSRGPGGPDLVSAAAISKAGAER